MAMERTFRGIIEVFMINCLASAEPCPFIRPDDLPPQRKPRLHNALGDAPWRSYAIVHFCEICEKRLETKLWQNGQ